ncbi:Helix-turn-helix domain-containing protein [Nocardiopsis flavescens]|uniref:Helix-turn-helix domain-containing protein n=1 Tax=Nocardiopsis flavescens TaxID=758803 RepID=A0A1M6V0R6_9ACTN|nr:helix-turn-helix transcriptional regulator [Nocardiopsis flavescens]SHK75107.1 Helix-turn-helix domain-containing protein [Nocardiopsis flavescens]
MGTDETAGPRSRTTLEGFLRARRDRVRPEEVGLAGTERRRVPGLRREEVAVLAGVSTDYYTRLEQGRERHPSAQVLDALARALLLDEEAAGHLRRLADARGGRPRGPRRSERVDPHLLRLLGRWADTPAFVLGGTLDLLALNGLARALYSGFASTGNLARMTFLDPAARVFHRDWDRAAASVVAELHKAAGTRPDDPRLGALVGELSLRSTEFRVLWSRHEVRGKGRGTKALHHAAVGDLEVHYQGFTVNGADAGGQQLIVYQAEPGSPSEEALALLGSLHTAYRADEGSERDTGAASGRA